MPALKAILVAKKVMIFREESYNDVRERATYCLSLSIANFLLFFNFYSSSKYSIT